MNDFQQRFGRELARMANVERIGRLWRVQAPASMECWVDTEHASCTCREYELTARPCKHVHCVYYAIAAGRVRVANDEQPWTQEPGIALHEENVFDQLLRDLCAGLCETHDATPGRRPHAHQAVAFSAIKEKFLGRSVVRAVNNHPVVASPDSVSTFLSDEASTPLLKTLLAESSAPLHLVEEGRVAIESAAMTATVTYERWFGQRRGPSRWLKLRLAMGVSTHAVVVAKVGTEADCPLLAADARNSEPLESFGITSYIPFNDNAVVNPRSDAWSRYLGAFLFDRERFVSRYGARSKVEEVISILKRQFGMALSPSSAVAQVNEILTRAIAHNLLAVTRAIFAAGLASRISPGTPLLKVVR